MPQDERTEHHITAGGGVCKAPQNEPNKPEPIDLEAPETLIKLANVINEVKAALPRGLTYRSYGMEKYDARDKIVIVLKISDDLLR